MHFVLCEECEGVSLLISHGPCCCGDDITIYPNSTDADQTKHVPKYHIDNDYIIVSVDHDMGKNNYIEWFYLETEDGGMIKKVKPMVNPSVRFFIGDDKPIAIYAYCTKHGIWKKEIKK